MVCTDGVHVVGKGGVPRCEGCARKQARVPGVQKPKAVAGCAAGHDIHVAVGVALDPVSVAEKSFQKGTDALKAECTVSVQAALKGAEAMLAAGCLQLNCC